MDPAVCRRGPRSRTSATCRVTSEGLRFLSKPLVKTGSEPSDGEGPGCRVARFGQLQCGPGTSYAGSAPAAGTTRLVAIPVSGCYSVASGMGCRPGHRGRPGIPGAVAALAQAGRLREARPVGRDCFIGFGQGTPGGLRG